MGKERFPIKSIRSAAQIAAFTIMISACKGAVPTQSLGSFDSSPLPIPTDMATATPTSRLTPIIAEPTSNLPIRPEQTPSLGYIYPGEFVRQGDPTKKILYITIDDLWHAETVRQILTTLSEEKVNASFFPIGSAIDPRNYPTQAQYIKDTYRMLVEQGNVVENHTYSHNTIQSNNSPAAIKAELEHQLAIVREVTGNSDYMQTWMRPPGGQGGLGVKYPTLGQAAENENVGILTWTVSSGGDGGASTPQIIDHVISNFENGAIILFHGYPNDANALKAIIEAGKAQGYTFDTVDHLVPNHATSCTFDTASFPSVKSC